MREIFDQNTINNILAPDRDKRNADIAESNTQSPWDVQALVLDLTVARLSTNPLEIKFPFKSIYVQDATDSTVSINIKVGTRDDFQSTFKLKKNDAWTSGAPIGSCYLDWSAQSGKTATIIFFTKSEFRSGSMISVNSGGISINEGDAVANSKVTLAATTAAVVLASSSNRKVGTLQNQTGASIWLGSSSSVTNSTTYFELVAGGILEWRNTAALYGYSVAGGDVTIVEET